MQRGEAMTVLNEICGEAVAAAPWAIRPSAPRVSAIDAGLRYRLADSLSYLGQVASLGDNEASLLTKVTARLQSGPVSPWVFCLYSKMVSELSKSPQGDITDIIADISAAAALPCDPGITPLRDSALPFLWWDHFQILFDTDRQRSFKPKAPTPNKFASCSAMINSALAILERGDREFHGEVTSLIRMVVLGAPGSTDASDRFNGASTFFLWGASLLNSNVERSNISMIDLLVHESSHVLLFGVSADGALTENTGSERFDSPLRRDKRPIDGIFHACFVATRVHLAMSRLLGSGTLNQDETIQAIERQRYNGSAAVNGIDELRRHAKLTRLGADVFGTLCSYWSDVTA